MKSTVRAVVEFVIDTEMCVGPDRDELERLQLQFGPDDQGDPMNIVLGATSDLGTTHPELFEFAINSLKVISLQNED
jgi:hypothetical protein